MSSAAAQTRGSPARAGGAALARVGPPPITPHGAKFDIDATSMDAALSHLRSHHSRKGVASSRSW